MTQYKEQLYLSLQDKDTIDYFQRLCGSFLLGTSLEEPTIIFFQGPAASGKTTIMRTLQDMFGDYAADIPANYVMKPQSTSTLKRLTNVRVIFVDDADTVNQISSDAIRAIHKIAPAAQLVIAAQQAPRIDDLAGLDVVVIPFKRARAEVWQ